MICKAVLVDADDYKCYHRITKRSTINIPRPINLIEGEYEVEYENKIVYLTKK